MSAANIARIQRWFAQVWTQGREETVDELFHSTGVAHGLGDSEADVHGPAEFKAFARNLRGAIPDIYISVEDAFCDGDKVAIRVHVNGTHTGPGLGVQPTGRSVQF